MVLRPVLAYVAPYHIEGTDTRESAQCTGDMGVPASFRQRSGMPRPHIGSPMLMQ